MRGISEGKGFYSCLVLEYIRRVEFITSPWLWRWDIVHSHVCRVGDFILFSNVEDNVDISRI